MSSALHVPAVRAAADAVAFLAPELADRVRCLASDVVRSLEGLEGGHALHGDFSSDQVVVAPSGDVAVIDFDEASLGPPGLDLGSFIAQLERDRTLGRASRERVEVLGGELLEGYGAVPPGLGACVAAGLVRLAPHVFRERADGWPERMEAVVAVAERAAWRPPSPWAATRRGPKRRHRTPRP